MAPAVFCAAPGPRVVRATTQRSTIVRAKKEKIYIGNGKYVSDDPEKYPTKTEWTGGWAGGEEGLWQFRDNIDVQKKTVRRGPATKLVGLGNGSDVIYTGKGNYIRDNAQKYPTKTKLTGGFAGGERGVTQFVAKGNVEFDEEFRPQNSPLIVGLAMSGVAIVISSIWFALGV